jgi:putative ABC transport system permease protein
MIAGAMLAEAGRALAANRLRSALTMLGMVIGVGAVVIMLAVGRGASLLVEEMIHSMGANLIIVLSGASQSGSVRISAGFPTLSLEDAQAIAELPTVAGAAPVTTRDGAQLVYGPNNWSTTVYGVTPEYFDVRQWNLVAGQIFNTAEVRSGLKVAILGQTVADNLFEGEDPVGKKLRIMNHSYQVIGVLERKGQSLDGRDQDDVVLVPFTAAHRTLFRYTRGKARFVMVETVSKEVLEQTESEITELLRQLHRTASKDEDDFTVRNLTALAETQAQATQALSTMLGAIASVSLLVGGIGIMNIMLVSVTERTREIGIRMAVGARGRDVLMQFLLEAAMLALLGCLVGMALGVGLGWAASQYLGMTVVITGRDLLLAAGVAAAVGLFFGFYPARRAARLDPIEALRYQ